MINRAPESQRGAALGAFTSFWDVGIAVGAPASGLIASLTNYTDIYFVMAGCAVLSALLAAPGLVPGRVPAAGPVAGPAAEPVARATADPARGDLPR